MKRIAVAIRWFVCRAVRSVGLGSTKSQKQVAALPIQRSADGSIRVLVVTSRNTKRFIVPKGWPMKGIEDHQAAAIEALEEAGVVGSIHKKQIGSYTIEKLDNICGLRLITVHVFLLDVEEERSAWKEKGQRERRWLGVADAAALVDAQGLADIIRRLSDRLPKSQSRSDAPNA